ncbi:MAG: outer membrane beta-barrel protein [Planctomycetes bacterium]|nr:outer membrane beta-barrel protein [Planctomycetota bacterium]
MASPPTRPTQPAADFTGPSPNWPKRTTFLSPLTWLKPDDKETEKNGTGFGFGYGLMFDFRFGDNYSLSTGLNLVGTTAKLDYLNTDSLGIVFTYGTGSKEKKDTIFGPFTNTYRINYFELPIHLLLKTNEIGYLTYFGQFGLATQFKTKARVDASVNDIVDEEVGEEIKLINMALSIGAGFEYSLGGNTKLIVALVYTNGFTDVLKNADQTANSKSFGLKLGIMF